MSLIVLRTAHTPPDARDRRGSPAVDVFGGGHRLAGSRQHDPANLLRSRSLLLLGHPPHWPSGGAWRVIDANTGKTVYRVHNLDGHGRTFIEVPYADERGPPPIPVAGVLVILGPQTAVLTTWRAAATLTLQQPLPLCCSWGY